jgi:hypothetical protein
LFWENSCQATEDVVGLQAHPQYPFFWLLSHSGALEGRDWYTGELSELVNTESIPELDAVEKFRNLPKFQARGWVKPSAAPVNILAHQTQNFVAFLFPSSYISNSFIIYSVMDPTAEYPYRLGNV